MADARPWRLDEGTRAWLREAVGDPAALPFAEAVALQLARAGGGGPEAEPEAAERVAALLRGGADAAARLGADLPLLAAAFQNADLLFLHGWTGADALSLGVMRALEILDPPD